MVPLIWEDTYTNLIEFVSTVLRYFWGFGILSDAYGYVLIRDEIDITLFTIKDDKLTWVESFHCGKVRLC